MKVGMQVVKSALLIVILNNIKLANVMYKKPQAKQSKIKNRTEHTNTHLN